MKGDAAMWRRLAWTGAGAALVLLYSLAVAVAAPRAVIVGDSHRNAGDQEPGKVLEYDFPLRNDGDATLVIADLKPTCYCTSAKTNLWDVPPGGKATIHVRIDPSDFVGKVNKGVEIETNDPDNPVLLVDVDINVLPGIAVVPPEIDFGNVGPEGTKKSQKVDVKVPRTRQLEILEVKSAADFIAVTQEPLNLEDRHGVSVYVKVLPGAPPGPFATTVVVRTSDAASPSIEISLRGRGPGGLRAQPEKVVFEAAAAGTEVGSFEVTGGKNLEVKS